MAGSILQGGPAAGGAPSGNPFRDVVMDLIAGPGHPAADPNAQTQYPDKPEFPPAPAPDLTQKGTFNAHLENEEAGPWGNPIARATAGHPPMSPRMTSAPGSVGGEVTNTVRPEEPGDNDMGKGGLLPKVGGPNEPYPLAGHSAPYHGTATGRGGDDVRAGIIETARALQIDPVDLATAISYETGGTFDPTKPGPRTQWGRHRGLIQFGEPQARQFGVDWANPVGSQLGPNGAVAKYLLASGFKPGMDFKDLYSTINAGAPGRYNASDANNGGAPGNVADKVNSRQMQAHRAKAAAFIGGAGSAPGNFSSPVSAAATGAAGVQGLGETVRASLGVADNIGPMGDKTARGPNMFVDPSMQVPSAGGPAAMKVEQAIRSGDSSPLVGMSKNDIIKTLINLGQTRTSSKVKPVKIVQPGDAPGVTKATADDFYTINDVGKAISGRGKRNQQSPRGRQPGRT